MLATLIPNDQGVVDIYAQTTYGALNGLVPTDGRGSLTFGKVLNEPAAPYTVQTYERVVILMTGGFAD